MKIAIDGYAGSGKSTIAKKVSKDLNFTYIDTGAMYRMIAYYYIINNIDIDKQLDIETLEKIKMDIEYDKFYLEGEDVSDKIRNFNVNNILPKITKQKNVREVLVKKQRDLAKNKDVILDGRDIGSVVFPDAQVKFFLTASPEIRAKRRLKQLKEINEKVSFEEVLVEIKSRDYADTSREISPLIKTEDAIEIDTSVLSEDETYKKIKELILKNIKK